MGADLYHADGQTDRYDVASSRFSQFFFFLQRAAKKDMIYMLHVYSFYGLNNL